MAHPPGSQTENVFSGTQVIESDKGTGAAQFFAKVAVTYGSWGKFGKEADQAVPLDPFIPLIQEEGPVAWMRRIEVWVEERQERMVFVTNQLKLAASTIAAASRRLLSTAWPRGVGRSRIRASMMPRIGTAWSTSATTTKTAYCCSGCSPPWRSPWKGSTGCASCTAAITRSTAPFNWFACFGSASDSPGAATQAEPTTPPHTSFSICSALPTAAKGNPAPECLRKPTPSQARVSQLLKNPLCSPSTCSRKQNFRNGCGDKGTVDTQGNGVLESRLEQRGSITAHSCEHVHIFR